ncbi:hypothetical protein PUNSTDRAFT_91505 [Punctularia strigosozonata HHB-11173 SS5]|uniref:uncharacterized protein n=1 Tax=Punctularia strigosozonata (strain HHB-11173) TaxID=741275 RepID=UPI0004418379|nr:uncharacterized protein PUNSTDRAFT_91505 [Punctularia strigosozonata HHB-11173 SS5]EIN05863.1 hypothetical protein PUNSTDRAFT_91505 [Punctularia strigosozonata HHB-11173 SS5]
MQGQDPDDPNNEGGWFVPVVVSHGREAQDKAGNKSLVFDAVVNSKLKSRAAADTEFRFFLVELALQHIESQSGIPLSRDIKTPNIASKGKLEPRTVLVPQALLELNPSPAYQTGNSRHGTAEIIPQPETHQGKKKLIEEIDPSPVQDVSSPKLKPKGILKRSSTNDGGPMSGPIVAADEASPRLLQTRSPEWSWSQQGDQIRVDIRVPGMTRDLVSKSALDLEPRRLLLEVPGMYSLDVDIAAANGGKAGVNKLLDLSNAREFDVDSARAEWRVAEGILSLYA